jgi:cyclopropane fatty-acyl-phospholipid synthase-like methyltransferase
MSIREQMDKIYQDLSPEKIPWNLSEPPKILVELVESGRIKPCRAVDLGCGAGNYAVWMTSQGFEMTGIDISPRAIALAEETARARGLACRFLAADLMGVLPELAGSFDFAYDWEVLHHVFPQDRPRYLSNVHAMLSDQGSYLSVCFSEKDQTFPGEGKIRTTRLGTELYLSSEDELRELFEPLFEIKELKTVEVAGKYQPHQAVVALMER